MILELLPFLTASILLTLSPGPDIIYVLVQGMSNGKKAGFITTLGLTVGILVHTSLVAFGVSAIIKESLIVFNLIKVFGALYLLYLAYKVFKSDANISIGSAKELSKNYLSLFKQGFIMNVLNPKVTIFFLAFLPGFLWDPQGNTVYQFYLLGTLFMMQTLVIFGTVAILAGKISLFLRKYPSSGIYIKWTQIIVFTGIALYILL